MKKIIVILLMVLSVASCEKAQDPVDPNVANEIVQKELSDKYGVAEEILTVQSQVASLSLSIQNLGFLGADKSLPTSTINQYLDLREKVIENDAVVFEALKALISGSQYEAKETATSAKSSNRAIMSEIKKLEKEVVKSPDGKKGGGLPTSFGGGITVSIEDWEVIETDIYVY